MVREEEESYSKQQTYKLTSPVLIKSYNKFVKKNAIDFRNKSEVHRKIHDSYLKIEYDYKAAIARKKPDIIFIASMDHYMN